MSTTRMGLSPELRRTGRHAGYAIAVVVNLAMLIIALNILEWGWLPFLTGEFNTVLPWISLSLVATIVANLVYQLNDTPGVRATGQIGVNLISLFVTFQIWQVFPFDFSAYGFDWGAVARILLIVAMVGAGIGVLTEALRLASAEPDRERR